MTEEASRNSRLIDSILGQSTASLELIEGARAAQDFLAAARPKLELLQTPALGLTQLGQIGIQGLDTPAAFGNQLLGGIDVDVVNRWRDLLTLEGDAARSLVSGSMAGLVADLNIGRIAAQPLLADYAGADLRSAVGEAAMEFITGVGSGLRESVIESIQPAAFLATSSMLERLRESTEIQREYDEALTRLGWWMPPSVSMEFFWEVGRLAYEGRRTELRRTMVDASKSRAFARVVTGWMDLPEFAARRRFIRDGIRDHRAGRYRVSIRTLIPDIEGIAIDAFTPRSTATNPKAAINLAVESYDAVMGPAVAEVVTILWKRQSFDLLRAGSRSLNRQSILHGRSTGYGTAENSAKVLFALDLLASLVEGARRHPEWAKAS
jgi:hypothetical protein